MAEEEKSFELKDLFTPFTTIKATLWIIVIGVLVYANTFFNGFVWDDLSYLINNSKMHELNIAYFIGDNIYNSIGFYRPLAAIYFGSMYSFFGEQQFFYHFIQLSIHIANTMLIFILFKRFFSITSSFFLSLIFLTHPIQVESVSWISATVIPMSFLLGMSAFLLSLKKRISVQDKTVIFLLLLAAILTRETSILFILIIVGFQLFFKKSNILFFSISGLIIFSSFFVLRYMTTGVFFESSTVYPVSNLTLLEKITNMPAIIFYYLKTFFIPSALAIDQLWVVKDISVSTFYFPLTVVSFFFIALLILGKYLYEIGKKQFTIFLIFFSWFFIGLSTHLQILPLDMIVADRWFYFPMVGLLGIIGIGISSVNYKVTNTKFITVVVVGILLILSTRTISRNMDWASPIKLYSTDLKITDNYDLRNALALELIKEKKYKEAFIHASKSVEYYPNWSNMSNLGLIHRNLGNKMEAKKYFEMAVDDIEKSSLAYLFDTPYVNLVDHILLNEGPESASKYAKSYLERVPSSARLWSLLAIAEYKRGNNKEALSAASKSMRFSSDVLYKYIYVQIEKEEIIPPYTD